jgi:hypothetical protein
MLTKKITRKEAGWLGHLASVKTIAEKKQKRIDAYNLSPKFCRQCSTKYQTKPSPST